MSIKWTTEKRKVADLIPMMENPRRLTERQEAVLKESLEKFDLVEIPAIDTDNVILAGHQRLAMLAKLGRGEETIDVRVPDRKLTDEERREYNLRSNKNTGEWDEEKLAEYFSREEMLKAGFTDEEVGKMLKDAMEVKEDDHEVVLAGTPVAKYGEVYELDGHRLMCGDATKAEDVAKLMDGQVAQMVFTDPPYNVDYKGGGEETREGILNDKMHKDAFYHFLFAALKNMMEHTAGCFYVCMSSSELASLKVAFEEAGGHWQSFLIWAKNTFTLGRSDWHNQYEPILYGWKDGVVNHYFVGWRDEGNVWKGLDKHHASFADGKTTLKFGEFHVELDGEVTGRFLSKEGQTDIWNEKKPAKNVEHPTMKPIKLVAKAIEASSRFGDIVLDLFGGSGSTLIACSKTGRKCFTMELDPQYVDVIIKRWQDMTGRKAVKVCE